MVKRKLKKLDSGQPSKTAQFMALFRALEYSYPQERRLFEDSLARSFLSPSLKAIVFASRFSVTHKMILSILDRYWTGARASGIARTRLIDDSLLRAIQNGAQQIVILGSGFDSRAYRIPEMNNLQIFEVDHPSTLTVKKQKLLDALGVLPSNVTYVETDFNHQSLEQTLQTAGFKKERQSFVIWEGVTNYLTESAVRHTLHFIGTLAEETLIAFTYVHQDAINTPDQYVKDGVLNILQKHGEPWTFGILPNKLSEFLQECGLQLLEEMDSVEYRKRYMYPQGSHLKGYEFYRVALAKV